MKDTSFIILEPEIDGRSLQSIGYYLDTKRRTLKPTPGRVLSYKLYLRDTTGSTGKKREERTPGLEFY